MFEDVVPKHKIGCLTPLSVVDNAAYEFYRIAPPRTMAVMIPLGLSEFTPEDAERVFESLDAHLDKLVQRGVHLITQTGVPLPILIGIEAHDRMTAHIAEYTGVPATSTVSSVVRATAHLGVRRVALANKWTTQMNASLAEFFSTEGVSVVGTATEELTPAEFQAIDSRGNMRLAYELGRRAFLEYPDCDGVYLGGGAWLVEPVANRLEAEFGKPVVCNQTAAIWDALTMLGDWRPIEGHGRLLAG